MNIWKWFKKEEKELYIVGKVVNNNWEFAGIFEKEDVAVKNCFANNYFVARVYLNREVPIESQDFEYAYYPKLK